MIVSKKYGFIFLKIRKTAGTSIEIALSRATARDDVITPISADDEILRQKWGAWSPELRGPARWPGSLQPCASKAGS